MGIGNFFQHLFLVIASLLGLIGLPLPLPLPPLPEDPALLRVAPADSSLFVQWFGGGPPAENPTNRSERLAAEPEVHTAVTKLVAALRGGLQEQLGRREPNRAAFMIIDLALAALQRPGALFVVDMRPLSVGLVAKMGDSAPKSAATFSAAMALIPSEATVQARQIGGVEFQTLPLPAEMGFLGWAAIDGYFAVAIGETCAAQIVAGLQDEDPGLSGSGALQRLHRNCKVERPVFRTYAALARLTKQLGFPRTFWGPLGISQAPAAFAESGLEGDDFVSRLELSLPKPAGLLGELRGKALSQDDLGLVPDDAAIAVALRAKTGSFEPVLLHALQAITGQDPARDWQQFLARAKETSTVDMRDDLIAHAEDCAVAWCSPGQGGMGFTAAVAAVPLRDGAAFGDNLTTMWEKMVDVAPNKQKEREQGNRLGHRGYLEHFLHEGSKVWWVDLVDRDFPFGISWTATKQHFLLGLQPQPVRSAISASAMPNFDRALVRQPFVARRGAANALFYLDLKSTLEQAYGPLMLLFQWNSHEWQREGIDFDLADVPRLATVAPHLGPELLVLEALPSGCRITRRGSLPVMDLLFVTCGMACLLQVDG